MYHFIVNPNAKTGRGGKIWGQIEKELKTRGIKYTVFFTEHNYHATEIAKSLTFDGIQRNIVVVGGDGTVNEVINGIIKLDSVVLGYIPAGSSNDLARSLGIPSDPIKALECILNPKYFTHMDIGEITYGNNICRRFDVSSGIGFDAAVCYKVNNSSLKDKLNKLHLGKLVYFAVALQEIFGRKNFKANVIIDDVHKMNFNKVLFMAAMNQKYEGGGFKFCPKAQNNDGKLDLIIADSIAKLRVVAILPTAFKGWHVNFRGIHILRGSKIEVITKERQHVHLDGESGFLQSRVIFKCCSQQLKVITPVEFN